ncbi:hypothetical protein EDD16DRAFT_1829182 [Pisolithus croceorrhizus]|nr:hypothetical protein EDD16DRAFT_1829182 [Pisolithus croceorrhizus]
MGHHHEHERAYNEYNNLPATEHQAKLSHELIAGAAAYEAAKAYENHRAKNGEPASHAQAKELLAGFAGAFIDREVETKGLDFLDRQKAKRHGKYSLKLSSLDFLLNAIGTAEEQAHRYTGF